MHKWKLIGYVTFVFLGMGMTNVQAQIFENDYQYITLAEIVPDTMNGWILDDSLVRVQVPKWYFTTLIENNDVDVSRLVNEVRLTAADKEILFTELFAPIPENAIIEEADCYEPRHAILFYNQNNVLVGIVEVCFMCFKTKEAGICLDTGISMLTENYLHLRKLFAAKGLNVSEDYGKPNYHYPEN